MVRSLKVLVSVSPDSATSKDARVGGSFFKVRSALVHAVHGLEVFGLVGSSVTDDDLTRVLVRHDDTRLGELRSLGVGVVCAQGLLRHT
jgi:hypothetical protein